MCGLNVGSSFYKLLRGDWNVEATESRTLFYATLRSSLATLSKDG
jgi:hypothetical protein